MFAVILMVMMMIVGNHFDDLGNGDEKGSGSSWKYNKMIMENCCHLQ